MRIYYSASDDGGSGYYRMYLPAQYTEKAGHEVKLHFGTPQATVASVIADIVDFRPDLCILQRKWDVRFTLIIKQLQNFGIKVVYELDDNIWELPAGNPSCRFWTPEVLKQTEQIMRACDCMITSTEAMKETLSDRIQAKVYVIPNYIPDYSYKRCNGHDRLKIGYSGSQSHAIDFNPEILKVLLAIKKDFDVELCFFGYVPPRLMGLCRRNNEVSPGTYMQKLAEQEFDIGIAPCARIRFNSCRSNVKFLEYGILGIPSVLSDVRPYADLKPYAKLVDNEYEEWYEKIELLVKSESKRHEYGNSARKYVNDNFLMENNVSFIIKTYEDIVG